MVDLVRDQIIRNRCQCLSAQNWNLEERGLEGPSPGSAQPSHRSTLLKMLHAIESEGFVSKTKRSVEVVDVVDGEANRVVTNVQQLRGPRTNF